MKAIGDTEALRQRRLRMVDTQVKARGVKDERVLRAMGEVPRHVFVDPALWDQAYDDNPLPIAEGQTISQPYIVAAMVEALELKTADRVLEIGTGSGYQTAVLSLLAAKVFTVERHKGLSFAAQKTLQDLAVHNVMFRVFDGTAGWAEHAPYDAIVASAGGPKVPRSFVEQLADGGRLVMPVGDVQVQKLMRYTRRGNRIAEKNLGDCRFVRLIGKEGWADD